MNKVLLIGYRPGLERAIRRLGYDPVIVLQKMKPGIEALDIILVRSIESPEEVLGAVLRRHPVGDFAAAVTGHEQGVFTTLVARLALNLPGDKDLGRSLVFRDKHLQKMHLGDSVAHAESVPIEPTDTYHCLSRQLGQRFFVKPSSGFGSDGVKLVESASDFEAALPGIASSFQYLAESRVVGPEFHVDGVWWDDSVLWLSLARYLDSPYKCNDDGIMADHIVTEVMNSALFTHAEELVGNALSALQAPNGVFHLEAFISEYGLVLGEIAIRPPGGHVPEIIDLTYGVDLFEAHVQAALEQRPSIKARVVNPSPVFGFVYLRRFPGSQLSIDFYRQNFQNICQIELADSPTGGGAYNRDGFAIVQAASESHLQAAMLELVEVNGADRG